MCFLLKYVELENTTHLFLVVVVWFVIMMSQIMTAQDQSPNLDFFLGHYHLCSVGIFGLAEIDSPARTYKHLWFFNLSVRTI